MKMKTRRSTEEVNSKIGKSGSAILVNLNDSETTIINGNAESNDLKELLVNDKSVSPGEIPRKSSRQRRGPVRYHESPTLPVKSLVIPEESKISEIPAKPEKRVKKTEDKENTKKGKTNVNGKKQIGQKMTDYEKMIQKNIEERNAFLASMMKEEGDSFEEEKPVKKRKKHDSTLNNEEVEAAPRKKRRKTAAKKKSYSDDEDDEQDEEEIGYNTRSRESKVKARGMYKEIGSSEDSVTENDCTLDTVSDNEDDEEYEDGARPKIKTRRWKKAKTSRIVTRKFALLQQKREERKAKQNSKNSENDETESRDDKTVEDVFMENAVSSGNSSDSETLGLKEDEEMNGMNTTDKEMGNGHLMEEDKENSIPENSHLKDSNETLPPKKLD